MTNSFANIKILFPSKSFYFFIHLKGKGNNGEDDC